MAKTSPLLNSFSAGEYSILTQGRVDLDRYPASARSLLNFCALSQGPITPRPGTQFTSRAYSRDFNSNLIPFVYDEQDAVMLEFTDGRVLFHAEDGVLTYAPVEFTGNVVSGAPLQLLIDNLDAAVGDQVIFSGWPVDNRMNGKTAKITAKVGDTYTFDVSYDGPTGAASRMASRIYHVSTVYAGGDVSLIRTAQSLDVLYLFTRGYKTYTLSRYDTYDWRFEEFKYEGGPWMPGTNKNGVLRLSGDGDAANNAIVTVSSTEFGGGASALIDGRPSNYWTTADPNNTNQTATFQLTAASVVTGYTIYVAQGVDFVNTETAYSGVDLAPGSFRLEGSNNGSSWTVLDSQNAFVLYENGRSVHFKIDNNTAYSYYRLYVESTTRNGPKRIGVGEVTLTTNNDAVRVVTANLSGNYPELNRGAGFLATDVGRLVRMRGSDSFWRTGEIVTRNSATQVTIRILDEPFLTASQPITEWQIGYIGDTLGYPSCGIFFDDRLWVAGLSGQPDLIAGSVVGDYANFQQRTQVNEVLDTSAVVGKLNSRRMSRIQWLHTDERGLLAGTTSSEWVISSTDNGAITAAKIKVRSSTERGSAFIDPVKVDRQILYVQTSKRTLREMTYVYEADGYKSPSMSLFASHLGAALIEQIAYAAEPHQILWCRRGDGSVVGFTYNRDENVLGWHRHDFAGGFITAIATMPSSQDNIDTLWLVADRVVNGNTERYIERMTKFWDFGMNIANAWFVDCAVKYQGPAVSELNGLDHLEGRTIEGVVDGAPLDPQTVTGGKVTFKQPIAKAILGLPYVSEGETARPEVGAEDGTAQGKVKRIDRCTLFLWDSIGGEMGVYDEDAMRDEWVPVEYRENHAQHQPHALQTGMFGPSVMPAGYNKAGSIRFRRTLPLPFNIISILPKMNTQDGS